MSWSMKSLAEVRALDLPPPSWDIEGLLTHDGGPALVFGAPGCMKSWLCMHACWCLATGTPFLGTMSTRKYDEVIYVNLDAPEIPTMRRFRAVGQNEEAPEGLNFLHLTEFDREKFARFLGEHRGAFVVLDCFANVYVPTTGREPGDDMRECLQWIRNAYEYSGCNGMMIDHAKKDGKDGSPGGYYGSVQKKATLRMMWEIRNEAPKKSGGQGTVKILCEKPGEFEPFMPQVAEYLFIGGEPIFTHKGEEEAPMTMLVPEPTLRDRCTDLLQEYPDIENRVAADTLGVEVNKTFQNLMSDIRRKRAGKAI